VQRLCVRRAAGLTNSEDQIVGANRFLPHLELIEAILQRADDQPVPGRYLERKVFKTCSPMTKWAVAAVETLVR
jgi:hypothetical protein